MVVNIHENLLKTGKNFNESNYCVEYLIYFSPVFVNANIVHILYSSRQLLIHYNLKLIHSDDNVR